MNQHDSTSKAICLVAENMTLADDFLNQLESETRDVEGVTREAYGPGEDIAHELLRKQAIRLGLEAYTDIAHNTYIRLPGSNPEAPPLMTGSHLDSQPRAGNYDGAAGIAASLTALKSIKDAGVTHPQDIILMACRAEEASGWYKGHHRGHIGSRAALGSLHPEELKTAIHVRDNRNLEQHFTERGMDPDAVPREPHLADTRIKGFLELHIEQGPILTTRSIPVGIVTGIRGNIRCRSATCTGEYTHSGGVPHEYRRDAVTATAEFIHRMDTKRRNVDTEGHDIVYATGRLYTNPELHAITKVAGETSFSVDVRSTEQKVLDSMGRYMTRLGEKIGAKHHVEFHLGEFSRTKPAIMDPQMRATLHRGCERLGINCTDIVSGGGHDAVEFSLNGTPSAMIFIRNENGSHNPHESIELDDLRLGTTLLTRALLNA
jgi:N-carbamoyl-L-amino-acid hydrolase